MKGTGEQNPHWSPVRFLRQLSTKIVKPVGQCVKKTDAEDPDGPQHDQVKQVTEKVEKIQKVKQNHVWSVQIMEKLLENEGLNSKPNKHGRRPKSNDPGIKFDIRKDFPVDVPTTAEDGDMENEKKESALLIATKNGIMEMVEKIFKMFPVAIEDINSEKKNIVLLAVEYRQPYVYKHTIETIREQPSVYYKMDNNGDGALHLAAKNHDDLQPAGIPGPALLMQWEIKWYQVCVNTLHTSIQVWTCGTRVQDSLHSLDSRSTCPYLYGCDIRISPSNWLKSTSESCSVVATLIATVAFATSTSIPGGVSSDNGVPILEREQAFSVFGISSLVALSFSVSSTFMFLGFINSSCSHHEKDFIWYVPIKILLELTCLFISLAAMMVSFCAAHYLIMRDHLNYGAFPLYLLIFLIVTIYASAQFPWYWGVASTIFSSLPEKCRSRGFS